MNYEQRMFDIANRIHRFDKLADDLEDAVNCYVELREMQDGLNSGDVKEAECPHTLTYLVKLQSTFDMMKNRIDWIAECIEEDMKSVQATIKNRDSEE